MTEIFLDFLGAYRMYITKKIIWKYVLCIDEKMKDSHYKEVQLRAGLLCNVRIHITLFTS
jgi:hypothetical protein